MSAGESLERGDITFDDISRLYAEPSRLSVIRDPRLRMLARYGHNLGPPTVHAGQVQAHPGTSNCACWPGTVQSRNQEPNLTAAYAPTSST
jgi:hypothetical protein